MSLIGHSNLNGNVRDWLEDSTLKRKEKICCSVCANLHLILRKDTFHSFLHFILCNRLFNCAGEIFPALSLLCGGIFVKSPCSFTTKLNINLCLIHIKNLSNRTQFTFLVSIYD